MLIPCSCEDMVEKSLIIRTRTIHIFNVLEKCLYTYSAYAKPQATQQKANTTKASTAAKIIVDSVFTVKKKRRLLNLFLYSRDDVHITQGLRLIYVLKRHAENDYKPFEKEFNQPFTKFNYIKKITTKVFDSFFVRAQTSSLSEPSILISQNRLGIYLFYFTPILYPF